MKMRPRPAGFTLIELLVVISVILLLAALTLPSLERAMQMAARAKCSSNMEQILRGCYLYATQCKRYFPNGRPVREGCGDDDLSRLVTGGFIQDIRVFACPATRQDPQQPEDIRHKATEGGEMSYEYRGQYNPRLGMSGVNPSFAGVLADEDGYHVNGVIDGDNHGTAGGHMAFLDAHVDWLAPERWIVVYTRSKKQWNP